MTLFSEARGRQVVSIATAETAGKVDQYLVDPARHAVAALVLSKTAEGDTLAWPDITAFGEDAVTVADGSTIRAADPELAHLADKERRILGKRVLTTAGDDIGAVSDVDFDPETGTIIALILKDGQVGGIRLIGVGSYAVVVEAP